MIEHILQNLAGVFIGLLLVLMSGAVFYAIVSFAIIGFRELRELIRFERVS